MEKFSNKKIQKWKKLKNKNLKNISMNKFERMNKNEKIKN